LLIIVITIAAMAGAMLVQVLSWDTLINEIHVTAFEGMLAILILGSTFMVVRAKSRLAALVGLGGIGFGVTIVFLMFSAPDLAATQFAVETLTVLLFVLVLFRLPKYVTISDPSSRFLDATAALLFGGMMTVITLVISAYPFTSHVSPFMEQASVPLAHGRNIVNVILVDFRGFDTMGEIIVLAIAAIGVSALLMFRPPESAPSPAKQQTVLPLLSYTRTRDSIILSTAARSLVPLMTLFSFFLLLRGHNEPGGGFTGGLIAASAFALFIIAYDVAHARSMLRVEPQTLMGVGLLIALFSGIPALFQGKPFMTGIWLPQKIPVIGKLGTPLIFDVGVYFLVLGIVLTIIFNLAEGAERNEK
jgi:multicomponent Na+:H+ antiporter subunit A